MKKILAISGGSYIGGAEIVTLQVLDGLQKKGNSIFCLTNGWNDGDFHHRLEAIGITYQAIKLGWFYLKKPLWTADTLFHLPTALAQGRQVLKTTPHDLIYATSYRQLLLLYPFIKKPIILHVHDPLGRDRNSRWIIRWLDGKITTYIAVSEFIKRDLMNGGVNKNKIRVVHNGIDIHPSPSPNHIQDAEKVILGIAGQIIPRKGHQDAIEALWILVDKGYTNFQLYIVGKGDLNFIAELKQMISTYQLEPYVAWRGFQHSLPEIYKGINILLAPTRTPEPFGMIAIEANSLGIPVIASKTGGLPEIITHGWNGWLVKPGAPEELAATLVQAIEQKCLIKEYGRNGYRMVQENFSTERQIRQIHQLISSLAPQEALR